MIFADRTAILYKMKEKKLISEAAVNCAEFLCGLENDTSDDEKQALAAVSALLFEWGSAGSICLTEEDVVKFAAENRNDLPDGFRKVCCRKQERSSGRFSRLEKDDNCPFRKFRLYL